MTAVPGRVRAGRLVMVDIPGPSLDKATAAFLRRHDVRAVCLFRRNLGTESEVCALTRDLRDAMGPGALIGLDQEGGAVVRSTFLPQAPSAMSLGAADSESLAHEVGAAVARGLRALGINWNFAPVLDVNSNPANPVIAERAFGETPQRVARLAGAWMQGSLAEGVACCVKHFPGHGDTHQDSHHALPTVDKPLAELQALELAPFRLLAASAPAIMTAHIVYPQLDPVYPATLSKTILGGLLREQWGYEGVVITDALMMKAVADRWGYDRAAVLAITAGADLVLAQGPVAEQERAIAALEDALDAGTLSTETVARAAARLDALAARFPLHAAEADRYPAEQRRADDGLMHSAWAAGLVALRGAMPPRRGLPLRVVVQTGVPSDQVSEAGIDAASVLALFEDFDDVQPWVVDDLATLRWDTMPVDGRYTVLVSTRRDRYGAAAAGWRPALHLVLWNPYQALDVPAPALLAFGHADGARAAVRAWLEGRAAATGSAPPSLAG